MSRREELLEGLNWDANGDISVSPVKTRKRPRPVEADPEGAAERAFLATMAEASMLSADFTASLLQRFRWFLHGETETVGAAGRMEVERTAEAEQESEDTLFEDALTEDEAEYSSDGELAAISSQMGDDTAAEATSVKHEAAMLRFQRTAESIPPAGRWDDDGWVLDSAKRVVAWTDGACVGNGRRGARAGWGVFFGAIDHPKNAAGAFPAAEVQTNNRAELKAILECLNIVPEDRPVHIVTDSDYSHKALTVWFRKWVRINHRKVQNQKS